MPVGDRFLRVFLECFILLDDTRIYPGGFGSEHHVRVLRSIGNIGIEDAGEGMHKVWIIRVIDPKAASAFFTEFSLAAASIAFSRLFIDHFRMISRDLGLSLFDLKLGMVRGDVDRISPSPHRLSADGAVAKLKGPIVFRFTFEDDRLAMTGTF